MIAEWQDNKVEDVLWRQTNTFGFESWKEALDAVTTNIKILEDKRRATFKLEIIESYECFKSELSISKYEHIDGW